MKFKNFFIAVVSVFVAIAFVACEPNTEGSGSNTDQNFAIDNVYLYGNCTDPINNQEDGLFGMNGGYTISTATLLNGSELAAHGTKIIGVRALIAGEVTDSEVYVTENLDSAGVRKSFTWVDEGWQYVLFDTPIEITGADMYIGYKITGAGHIIGFEPTKTACPTEMMWWNNQWWKLSDMGTNGLWSVQAIVQGGDYSDETQYEISVDELIMPNAVRANDQMKTIITVRNAGVRTISGFDVVTNVGGQEKVTSVNREMFNGQSAKVEIFVPVGDVEGTIEASVKVALRDDEMIVSSEHKSTLNVYAGLQRNAILIEQFTGQNCSNCPAGAAAIKKSISELADPNRVCWIAHHTYQYKDEFTVTGNLDVSTALGVVEYPMCNINRKELEYEPGKVGLIWHPVITTSSLLASLIPMPADASMELIREFNADTRELKVKVTGQSLKPEAYITVLVNQDNMVARQSGASGEYKHTSPRAFLSAAKGDKLTLDAEGNYSAEYTYTIPEKVGNFDCVLEDMEVVAFIHGDINNSSDREVFNADKVEILD